MLGEGEQRNQDLIRDFSSGHMQNASSNAVATASNGEIGKPEQQQQVSRSLCALD